MAMRVATGKPIYIYSGPIRSGKTTALMNWLAGKDNVAGILTPEVNGIRKLYDIAAREFFPFQAERESTAGEDQVTIGRFTFYQSAFARARLLLGAALKEHPRWLIIDEIGPLELNNHGFEPLVSQIICAFQADKFAGDLLLVVRDTLLEEVVSHYHIALYKLFDFGRQNQ
ncbi:MAG: hypothetical protein ONB44_02440 [candidate division KSB1 bacterium]|nr:hypothetical protein [candidate division KSB1 bacterium]MDZ7300983.1 hypothetical protein [candidate division KSB1 bacterium]MDZ7310339.1 hypothetical protein [candidate division KSB1 bacterium]